MNDFDPASMFSDEYERFESMSRAELIAEIKDRAESIVSRAEIIQPPEQEETSIHIEFEEGAQIYIPPGLLENLDPSTRLTEIVVRSDVDMTRLKASISVAFSAISSDGRVITVACSPKDSSVGVELAGGSDGGSVPGFMFSTAELNRMFASIYLRNKSGDYSIFDDLDLEDYEIIINITQALMKHVPHSVVHSRMKLSTKDKDTSCAIEYTRVEGILTDADITRYHADTNETTYSVTISGPELALDEQTMMLDEGIAIFSSSEAVDIELDTTRDGYLDLVEYLVQLEKATPYYTRNPFRHL